VSPRTDRVLELQSLVGDDLVVDELGTGWPSLVTLNTGGDPLPLAMFVSTVGLSHRDRDAVERRFQNPQGVPLIAVPGRHSVLLGLWSSDDFFHVKRTVVALADADRRESRDTRWSVFLALASLIEAADFGWSSSINETGERLLYFAPELLPVAVLTALTNVEPDERQIYRALAGLHRDKQGDDDQMADAERVRRTVNSLVRDSRFRGNVLGAYGSQCAMCGLGLGLVQGAHIYPASAPGSRDEVSNGLALCANHHLAFDRHLLAVHPLTGQVLLSPSVTLLAQSDSAVAEFLEGTRSFLRMPSQGRPDPEAFTRRYSHYGDKYAWLPSFE